MGLDCGKWVVDSRYMYKVTTGAVTRDRIHQGDSKETTQAIGSNCESFDRFVHSYLGSYSASQSQLVGGPSYGQRNMGILYNINIRASPNMYSAVIKTAARHDKICCKRKENANARACAVLLLTRRPYDTLI
jgi:hypothetical protein